MGDGEVLSDFVRWARETYPADKYGLIIWDHGQGWRFRRAVHVATSMHVSKDEIRALGDFRKAKGHKRSADIDSFDENNNVLPTSYVTAGSVRYVSSDDSSADHLFNREIQDSLLNDVGARQLDLLGFDACLMSMIETAFAMRDVADVMVGSEELEPGDGWNYELCLEPLLAAPDQSAEQLGAAIVDAYRQHYDPIDTETTLTAIKLRELDSLAQATTELADACVANLSGHASSIRTARAACSEYAPGYGLHGIDLKRFAGQLALHVANDDIEQAAQKVVDGVDVCVIENYAGADRMGSFGSSGLAVYFPSRRSLFNTDPDSEGYEESNGVYPVEFVQRHRWDNFLHAYLAINP
jgi:hypothetical protein